jgi:hypothetical protein
LVATARSTLAPMRTMFVVWTAVLLAGIVFFVIVGLTHG